MLANYHPWKIQINFHLFFQHSTVGKKGWWLGVRKVWRWSSKNVLHIPSRFRSLFLSIYSIKSSHYDNFHFLQLLQLDFLLYVPEYFTKKINLEGFSCEPFFKGTVTQNFNLLSSHSSCIYVTEFLTVREENFKMFSDTEIAYSQSRCWLCTIKRLAFSWDIAHTRDTCQNIFPRI